MNLGIDKQHLSVVLLAAAAFCAANSDQTTLAQVTVTTLLEHYLGAALKPLTLVLTQLLLCVA